MWLIGAYFANWVAFSNGRKAGVRLCLLLEAVQLKMSCESWVFLALDISEDGYPHKGVCRFHSRSASEGMSFPTRNKT